MLSAGWRVGSAAWTGTGTGVAPPLPMPCAVARSSERRPGQREPCPSPRLAVPSRGPCWAWVLQRRGDGGSLPAPAAPRGGEMGGLVGACLELVGDSTATGGKGWLGPSSAPSASFGWLCIGPLCQAESAQNFPKELNFVVQQRVEEQVRHGNPLRPRSLRGDGRPAMHRVRACRGHGQRSGCRRCRWHGARPAWRRTRAAERELLADGQIGICSLVLTAEGFGGKLTLAWFN